MLCDISVVIHLKKTTMALPSHKACPLPREQFRPTPCFQLRAALRPLSEIGMLLFISKQQRTIELSSAYADHNWMIYQRSVDWQDSKAKVTTVYCWTEALFPRYIQFTNNKRFTNHTTAKLLFRDEEITVITPEWNLFRESSHIWIIEWRWKSQIPLGSKSASFPHYNDTRWTTEGKKYFWYLEFLRSHKNPWHNGWSLCGLPRMRPLRIKVAKFDFNHISGFGEGDHRGCH